MDDHHNLHILSAYLKKWSYKDNKLTVNFTFCLNGNYQRKHKELRLGQTAGMVNELLNQIVKDAKNSGNSVSKSNTITLVNADEVKKKLSTFFSKIEKEFKQNKKSSGKSRMISSRSIDFYYNDYEYDQLTDDVKFYVHLNRGLNKVSGDLWSNAVSDFKMAIGFKPEDLTTNKYLAMAYNKLGQFSDAVTPLKIYADSENTPESLNALAIAYINLEEFDKADEIFAQIAENFNDSAISLFGRAQMAYKQGKEYISFLETINEDDPGWLANKLKSDWEYKLSPDDESLSVWNAATAARYLGFERPFDLTKKAFNQEIPCYFDSDKGTIRFVKEEIDCWIDLHNRFNIDGQKYQVYENNLLPEEKKPKKKKRKSAKTIS
jgi:tetratricopeptide (TPR) repeat protein